MATTYTLPALNTAMKTAGLAGEAITQYVEFVPSATPVINDVYQVLNIPNGARVIDWELGADDLDTNGSPTITLSLGDGGSTARYLSASTIAQSGGVPVQAALKTGFGYVYTANDTIDVLVAAAPATYASGTIRVMVRYVMTV